MCEAPSLSRYKDARIRCRCDGCRAINAAYMARYRKTRVLARETTLIDVTPCRTRLIELREDGVTYREIAESVGDVSLMQVYRIVNGQTLHCRPLVQERVRAVFGDG